MGGKVGALSRIRPGQPFATDFAPSGRSHYCIYAVVVKDHPEVTKVGRTNKWKSRRNGYANWNLAKGDGIVQERVFIITDEYVDLVKLENAILKSCPFPIRFGSEWFRAEFDDVCQYIERFLCAAAISYD